MGPTGNWIFLIPPGPGGPKRPQCALGINEGTWDKSWDEAVFMKSRFFPQVSPQMEKSG